MTTEGYADGLSRDPLPHPTDKIQPGVVVQHIKDGRQFKVLKTDHNTRQFTAHGGHRTDWYSFDDFLVLDGRTEPLDLNDPRIAIEDARRNLERLEKQAAANAAIEEKAKKAEAKKAEGKPA